MAWIPKYKLYNSSGTVLLYTFPLVQSDSSPSDRKDYVEIEGLRGVGSIIIPGSTEAFDLRLEFILQADDYEELIAAMDSLESTIVLQTNYILKIDRTQSTTKNYNIQRLLPFEFLDEGDFRNTFQRVICTFRTYSWS